MSEENVEIVKRAIGAFSDVGIDVALEYCDPEFKWWAPPEWLEDRLYRGHEGVRELAAFWTQQFDESSDRFSNRTRTTWSRACERL